jgi:transposase
MGRGDLTDAEWEQLRPLLPVSNGRCGRWRDHRQVIDGILYRIRTGAHWRDLPECYGPWKTVYERHGLWSADGTWERLLQQIQAAADAAGQIDWDISVDSTAVRAHQHAAGALNAAPPPVRKGDDCGELADESPWQSLCNLLVEVARVARDWAAHAADSPAKST